MTTRLITGDCRDVLATLPAESVQCCVTSPPYFGLRSYLPGGHADKAKELGTEPTPDAYVAELVAVFREVRRVLRGDGVAWLNLGDSYASIGRSEQKSSPKGTVGQERPKVARDIVWGKDRFGSFSWTLPGGIKPKDLIGIPWMVAFALRADGWYLRSDIIWHKPNPMPESVRDRPTKAHEYLFLLSKAERYYYDADAIAEPSVTSDPRRPYTSEGAKSLDGRAEWKSGQRRDGDSFALRNARSVWTIATAPFAEAHFATFPPELAERCIKAGSRPGDTVLDPFAGAGTTLLVADRLGRNGIGIELNPAYATMGADRVRNDAPLFAMVAA